MDGGALLPSPMHRRPIAILTPYVNMRRSALRELLRREFPRLQFEVLDLRREACARSAVIVERRKLPEDPRGYTLVNSVNAVVSRTKKAASMVRTTTRVHSPASLNGKLNI